MAKYVENPLGGMVGNSIFDLFLDVKENLVAIFQCKFLLFFTLFIFVATTFFRRVFLRPSETNSYLENRPLEMKTVNCKVVHHTIFNNFVVDHFSLKLLPIELWLFQNTLSLKTNNSKTKRICIKWSTGRF